MTPNESSVPSHTRQMIDEALASLSEDDLRYLNKRVVERLHALSRIKQAERLAHFAVGDRVFFIDNGVRQLGIVTKLNRKTVSIHTDDHHDWNVTATGVTKIIEQPPRASHPLKN